MLTQAPVVQNAPEGSGTRGAVYTPGRDWILLFQTTFEALLGIGETGSLVRLGSEGAPRSEGRPESELVALGWRLDNPLPGSLK